MTVGEYRKHLHDNLADLYSREELNSFTNLLLGHYLDYSRIEISVNLYKAIPSEKIESLNTAIQKLKKHVPIQYILGYTEFMGLKIKVGSQVLIPRPETEGLVQMIITDHKFSNQEISIMDIGTGSGCIAIALANNLPNAFITGIDISKKALNLAKENAQLNGVDLHLEQHDILNWQDTELENSKLLDIIVSNPPYVRLSEKNRMNKNVLDFEPHLALFVDDEDPLLFYRRIASFAREKLKHQGELYFEINEYLSKELTSMLRQFDFKSIELFKDIFGKDRMIKATKT